MLTLARIYPRNIYLNFFGGTNFHWKSIKACNIAKKTYLNYVWTAIFPWSYCSLKLQILRCFEQKVLKLQSVDSLWSGKSIHRRCSLRKDVLRNFAKFTGKQLCQSLAQMFSCEFCKISKNAFFTEYLLTTASYAYVT